jgi:3-isopropylmalate/(R)-2-methylmalate dehydratase small subunit
MEREYTGRCWKFGDDINVDTICPTKYYSLTEEELAEHCFEDLNPEFHEKVSLGDILVAGENFGYGLGHWHVNLAVRGCGIEAVVAESFGRSFFRHAIDFGMPPIECPGITDFVEEGDTISLDPTTGRVANHTQGTETHGQPLEKQRLEIIEAGGLLSYLKAR